MPTQLELGLWDKPDLWNDQSKNNSSDYLTSEVLPLQSSWRPILMFILIKLNKTKIIVLSEKHYS